MGRPEPCVLFAQTFVHSNLDEYVDEVLFAEPVVISACEFLEQNVSSASPAVTLNGATSPPSFALEVFVQCEGGTKFRRLCQPFLYSHSSSNVLEVEAVVTNHLVVRGCYRSLSLVVYGNTAEDLGQFNIEVDLDGSLADTVCSVEGNLDDLPPALHPPKLTIEDSISHLKELSLKLPASDISLEFKQLLQLTFKILEQSNHEDSISKVVNSVVSAASNYAGYSFNCTAMIEKQFAEEKSKNWGESNLTVTEALKELLNVYSSLERESQNLPVELLSEDMFLESEVDLATSKQLVNLFTQYFSVMSDCEIVGHPTLSQYENLILWLSMALFLTSGRESCYHFVNVGGMEKLGNIFSQSLRNSTAVMLLLLGIVEQATRYSIGCEGFLGWWPREDESIPSGASEGYNHLLKLLLEKQRHDVASLATCVLHRLRFYEVASRFECTVLSILGGLSDVGRVTSSTLDMLTNAKHQLKKLLNMINSRGLVEDPSPLASARKSLMLGETEGLLSYRSTSSLIASSTCGFSNWDIDLHLLSLLKERGFLPLSVALLSSSILRSEVGHALELFVDVTSYIEAIILSFLLFRSGLSFLLLDPELSTTIICALRGADNLKTEESVPLRYASSLISKGFFCCPQEVGIIVQTHLRVVSAVDHLIRLSPHSEETLWVLWELCGLSRSDCGRQALLAMSHFPEAVSVLISTLHSVKKLDPVSPNSGASPLNLAIFHSAAEIFEVIVTDSTASSLGFWVEHAKELQRALLASSPGSNRKDAPTRLLEWIDAGVVYQSNGAAGLLRYVAVLASGGDAHIATSSILSSESMDVENGVGDASSSSDGNVIDNVLGKAITEKKFPGISLADSTVAQLTTAFRVLACISENSAVAAALYDEGAVMVVHAVLIDCKLMLERSSNNYDYLVDEGAECSSTSDLLLERTREQGLIDLLIPCLILLINLLQRLQEAKEIHRNTKLMSALVQLHREVSPKLAASSTDLSYPYPAFALGFEAVCHLIVSALACWPIYGWTPGLFNFLVDSLKATSLLALGPKETCSLLCLLNDLFPEEGTWPWKNGMPVLSTLRTLAVGTLLGPRKERQVNWYMQPGFPEKLLDHLTPQLGMLGQIILHCALSMLVVMQDMLRVFIIRIACLNSGDASILLQPVIKWICNHLVEDLSDTDAYKVYRLLDFLAILLEHPRAKGLLLKGGAVQMLMRVLERCLNAANLEAKQCLDGRNVVCGFSSLSWCIPACKLISQISDSQTFEWPWMLDKPSRENLTAEDCAVFLSYLLRLCKVFPVGRELLACLSSFKELGACTAAQTALQMILSRVRNSGTEEGGGPGSWHEKLGNYTLVNTFEWKKQPPLLSCWTSLLRSIDSEDVPPVYAIEAVYTLSEGALRFCMDGDSLNLDRVVAVKYLFGLFDDINGTDAAYEENMKCVQHLMVLLDTKVSENDYSHTPDMSAPFCQAKQSVKSLLLLLEKPVDSVKAEDKISAIVSPSSIDLRPSRIHKVTDGSSERVDDYNLYGFGDKFFWECPESDRLSQSELPAKRKSSSLDGANRRSRGDNTPAEPTAQAAFSRGSGLSTAPPGPTRRDTFRQRKPNTSRPPSMHVDDYVARERNVDGAGSSNVIAVPRVGCTSGRPPSIHVDEFMARQRERQNPVGNVVNDVDAAQVKTAPPEKDTNEEKLSVSKHLKPDLDDDLQGIDIVFDAEEVEPDDRLPFPQPDDNLQQPAPIMGEQRSPHSVVEETESDINEHNQNELSSRMSVSRPQMSLAREPSTSSDKKYFEQHDDPSRTSSGFVSSATATAVYNKASGLTVDSRAQADFYTKNIQQTGVAPLAIGSQGFYDQRFSVNQPPLPPMPPPSMSTVLSKVPDYVHGQSSPFVMADLRGLQPTEYSSAMSNCSSSLVSSSPLSDSKHAQISLSSPGCSARPPPLPPTPPPYLATPTLSSLRPSTVQASVYNHSNFGATELQTSVASSTDAQLNNFSASGAILTSYQPPPLMPPMLLNRPSVVPMSLYGNSPSLHQGENQSSILQNLPTPLPAIHSLQSLSQLQPLQPPQLPRPSQPPQHLRPSIVALPQSDQGASLIQSSVPTQLQSLQPLQQSRVSPAHAYFQTHQEENFPHTLQQQVELSQLQVHQQDVTSQQLDAGMSLQHFFSSPEAIQSLLSDRDKLCQLLEQHPKLMQMLQERLGQL